MPQDKTIMVANRHDMAEAENESPALFFAPFVSSRMVPRTDWIDYNGHLNMAYYHVMFDQAVDEAFGLCGLGEDYVKIRRSSFFVVESRVSYRREVNRDDRVRITMQLIDFDEKRLHYYMEMRHASEGWLAATCENLSIHVDMATRRAAPFPPEIRANLAHLKRAHAGLPRPESLGCGIALPARQAVN